MIVIAHAAPITLFILTLFYYWFAIADRYSVFLYNHHGAMPFDEITVSRYWMSGLVADGAVMVLYTAACLVLMRFFRGFRVPEWWRVWVICAIPLGIGIPLITMTQNAPTLPLFLALACAAVTLVGLALALLPSSLAARQALFWLALDRIGIVAVLQLFRVIELPSRLPSFSMAMAQAVSLGSLIFGTLWLSAMSILQGWRHISSPSALALVVAGACWCYLALPLAHYLVAAPSDYRYITAAANFFASNVTMQLLTWVVAAGLAMAAALFRKRRLISFPISDICT